MARPTAVAFVLGGACRELGAPKQLAQYIERRVKPRRVDSVARISLALLTRLFEWWNAIVIVRQNTEPHDIHWAGVAASGRR